MLFSVSWLTTQEGLPGFTQPQTCQGLMFSISNLARKQSVAHGSMSDLLPMPWCVCHHPTENLHQGQMLAAMTDRLRLCVITVTTADKDRCPAAVRFLALGLSVSICAVNICPWVKTSPCVLTRSREVVSKIETSCWQSFPAGKPCLS